MWEKDIFKINITNTFIIYRFKPKPNQPWYSTVKGYLNKYHTATKEKL
jgi:hypothetical protein